MTSAITAALPAADHRDSHGATDTVAPVAVIIPVYNTEMALARCLDSVLGQSPRPAQVIVVDDGSSDRSPEIARAYGDRIIFLQQANAGQGAARNNGLGHATEEYVSFLDADDFWAPGFLAAMTDFLDGNPQAVAASSGYRILYHDGRERTWPSRDLVSSPRMLDDFFAFWAEHDHVRTGTVLLRREVALRVGGQNPALRISQDLEFWALLASEGPWGIVPDYLWVGDSARVAKAQGWKKKYEKRRKLCPTVEQWSERLTARIRPEQERGLARIRGRVAANYAHSKVLGGDAAGARAIVRKYGHEMPSTWLTKLMRRGAAMGPLGWWAACRLLAARETWKDWRG